MNKPDNQRLNVLFGFDTLACALEFDHEPIACESKLSQIERLYLKTSQARSNFINNIE